MASPFAVFRKNQKVLLAVTGILAMIAFVFLGTCIQTDRPVQAYENPTVVSWKHGDITAYEMDNRRSMRRILNSFLVQAARASGIPLEPLFPETEESVVASMVLAQRGRDLGLVVGDDVVNRLIAQITNNRLRPADLESIIATFSAGGQRVTPKMMFDALREELLANQTAMLFRDGMGVGAQGVPPLDTPAQRWDYFRRFEQRLKAQVLPVPVAEFTEAKEIGKPTEGQLKELFEKHKHQFALPASPEPGFRQPYKARFQYFKAGVEDLITAEMKNVSDEEIRDYYEKNKDSQFRQSKLPPLDTGETKSPGDAKTGSDKTGSDKTGSDKTGSEPSDAAKKDEAKKESVPSAKKDEPAAPDDAKSDELKSDEPQSSKAKSDDAKSDDVKTEDAKTDDAKKPDPLEPAAQEEKSTGKSARVRDNRFQLVAYQPEETKSSTPKAANEQGDTKAPSKGGAKEGKSGDKNSSPGTTADTKTQAAGAEASKADTAANKSDSGKTDQDAKTEQGGKDDNETKQSDGAKKEADAGKQEADGATKEGDAKSEPVQYKPLEEVRDTIRRAIASQRAQDQVEKKFVPLRNAMIRYAELRTRWQIEAATNPDEPQPKPLDIEALAQEHGVTAYNTAVLSRLDVEGNTDLDIAKSRDMNTRSSNFFQFWADIVFQPKGLFRPITTVVPGGGDSFLSWKVEEREGHVPQFEDVREDVVEAWKRIEARDLAKKKAEEYAKTVREAMQPLAEVFSKDENLPVREVGPFAWLTRPSVPFGMMQQLPPPEISKVPGVENAGDELMRTAFNLKAGEVGVAFNEPKSVVYVIQAVEFDPSESVLQREFMVMMKNYDRFRAAAGSEMARAQEQWLKTLYDEYQVHWHRTADMPLDEMD